MIRTCLIIFVLLTFAFFVLSLKSDFKYIPIKAFTDPIDGVNYRLPIDSYSTHHELYLTTDIHLGDFGYSGRVVVSSLAFLNATEIMMHSKGLTISNINLYHYDGEFREANLEFRFDELLDLLIITPSELLFFEKIYFFEIFFSGTLKTLQEGFYGLSYNNNLGGVSYIAATNFKSTEGRKAFPR